MKDMKYQKHQVYSTLPKIRITNTNTNVAVFSKILLYANFDPLGVSRAQKFNMKTYFGPCHLKLLKYSISIFA